MSRTTPPLRNVIEHTVRAYNAQNEGSTLVAGWQIEARVTAKTGRRFQPVLVAICMSEDDAKEIAALLNTKYADD